MQITCPLTTGADVKAGSSGNDSFVGGVGTVDSDHLTGGAGNDSLTLTLSNADDNNAAFASAGIENFNLRTIGNVALDLGDVSGVVTLTATRLNGDLTLNDVQDIADIVLDRNTNNSDVTVNYGAVVVAGAEDSLNVTIQNSADAGTVTADGIETVDLVSTNNPLDDTNELAIAGADIETVNISGSGDLTLVTAGATVNNEADGDVDLTAAAATAVTQSGSGALTVTASAAETIDQTGSGALVVASGAYALDAVITASGSGKTTVTAADDVTIDAADSTGALAVTDSGADVSATGGSAADTFTFSTHLDKDDTVVGGAGSDTLSFTLDAETYDDASSTGDADDALTVSGVEIVQIAAADAATNGLDFNIFSGKADITSVELTSKEANDGQTDTDVNLVNFTLAALTVNSAKTTDDGDFGTIDIELKTDTAADSLTININNRQTAATTSDDNSFDIAVIDSDDTETLTLNTSFVSSSEDADEITIGEVSGSDLKTLNLTGTANVTVGAVNAVTATTVNAATYTGTVDITLGAAAQTVTGGTKADTLNFGANLTSADVVDGGAGSDTVVFQVASSTGLNTIKLSNVETVAIQADGSDAGTATTSFASTTGVEALVLTQGNDSSDDIRVTNLKATTTDITINDDLDNVSVSYATGVTADVTVTVAGDNADPVTEDVTVDGLTVNNGATLTITADGGNTTSQNWSEVNALTTTATTINAVGIEGVYLAIYDVNASKATAVNVTSVDGGDADMWWESGNGNASQNDDYAKLENVTVTANGDSYAGWDGEKTPASGSASVNALTVTANDTDSDAEAQLKVEAAGDATVGTVTVNALNDSYAKAEVYADTNGTANDASIGAINITTTNTAGDDGYADVYAYVYANDGANNSGNATVGLVTAEISASTDDIEGWGESFFEVYAYTDTGAVTFDGLNATVGENSQAYFEFWGGSNDASGSVTLTDLTVSVGTDAEVEVTLAEDSANDEFTVSGGTFSGEGSITLVLKGYSDNSEYTTFDLSNLDTSGFTGTLTITTDSDVESVTGTAYGEEIDLSDNADATVVGGAGADNIILGTGNEVETVKFAEASDSQDGAMDVVENFVSGEDFIDVTAFNLTGGALNTTAVTTADVTMNRPGSTRHFRAVGIDVFRTLPEKHRQTCCGGVWGCRTSRCN